MAQSKVPMPMSIRVTRSFFFNHHLIIPSVIKVLLFVALVEKHASVHGELVLTHFSATNQMPGESVTCMYQDNLGLLWIGFETVGLIKFDGKTPMHFRHDSENLETISSNHPTAIVEDHEGFLWVGTSNGLNKLNRTTGIFKRFHHEAGNKNSLPSDYINDLLIDPAGNLWVATRNGVAIMNLNTEVIIRVLHNPEPTLPAMDNEVHALHMDARGNIWIGTALNGLYMVPRETSINLEEKWYSSPIAEITIPNDKILSWKHQIDIKNSRTIRSITSSHPDTIWIGSQQGLLYFLVQEQRFERFRFTFPEQGVLNICAFLTLFIDRGNNLWAGCSNDGLAVINLATRDVNYLTASHFAINNLKSNDIRDIIQTRCGLIWIATKFGGLHYFDQRKQKFPRLTTKSNSGINLQDEHALSIAEGHDNQLWIGTKGGGLFALNPNTGELTSFITSTGTNHLPDRRIEHVLVDENHTIWIGAEYGLYSKVKNEVAFHRHAEMHVRNIFITNDNYIWIGTSHGLFRYSITLGRLDPLASKHADFFDVQSNLYITRVFEDSKGVLWIATNSKGLFEYHHQADSLIHHEYLIQDGINEVGNQPRAIFEDSRNQLWIGTKTDGLFKYDRERKIFISISTPYNLISNTVYNIIEDEQKNLWMGTHGGITRYNPASNSFDNFSTRHGLQGSVFETNAHLITTNGYLMMGGHGGINKFKPADIVKDTLQAPIVISRFEVLNTLKALDIPENSRFELKRQQNHIAFTFALLDFVDPKANEYAYMLYPIEKEWVYSGSRNFVSYANLYPGTYTFKVKGANSDGFWMSDILEVMIVIPTPIWQKGWFIPLLVVLSISLVIMAYYLRVKAGLRGEALLKAEVQQRTVDLSEANKQLEKFNQQIEKHNKTLRLQKERISRQNLELTIHRQNLELMVIDRTRDLEDAKQKAEESDRLKTAFLANMSHEIRTPLNAIMGFIDLLEADEFDKEERIKINAIIQTNSNSLLQLINDIIDISMIEANQLVIKKQTVNFNEFLNDLYTHYQSNSELNQKGIGWLLSKPEIEIPFLISIDPYRVRQVFTNLVNNAIKFTEKGTITLGCKTDYPNKRVVCFVEDTGPGISEENTGRLFERFRKLEPSQLKVYRGTGLGLSISKNLCELMGGDIWVKSQLEVGSTFYFTLPMDQ